MEVLSRFTAFAKQKNLFAPGDRILVAFSGGKDSLCLLSLLCQIRNDWNLSVGACHIHHMIRGAEADEDALFCENFCKERNIPFYREQCNVPQFCKENHLGLEEGARILRYRFLNEVAKREHYNQIATAHTATDQAETILFRLIRGSGTEGLIGIPAKRENLIRPLLPFTQEEVLFYLKEEGLTYRVDSTNSDSSLSRNRIRNRVFPELKEINPNMEEALLRFSQIAAYQSALCQKHCENLEAEEEITFSSGESPLAPLIKLAQSEADYPILHTALSKMCKPKKISIPLERFLSLVSLLKEPIEGKIIEISNGYVFQIKNGCLRFGPFETKGEKEFEIAVTLGENPIVPLGQSLTIQKEKAGEISNINKKCLILEASFDRIVGNLSMRNVRFGDTVQMNGMTKRVKKLLSDLHLPTFLKKEIPVLCDQEEILWIPFVGLCDKLRPKESTFKVRLSLSGGRLAELQSMIEKESPNGKRI